MNSPLNFAICGCSALLLVGTARAQDEITYRWVVSDTGNGNGIVEPGEAAVLTLVGEMAPQAFGFGATFFDMLGGVDWNTGLILSFENLFNEYTDDGELVGGDILNIEPFQLPLFFNEDFDASNPVSLFQILWQPDDYAPRSVGLTSAGHPWNDIYTDEFGSNASYTPIIEAGLFEVTDSLGCGVDWTLRSSGGPSARLGATMAYDSTRQVVVLFGGRGDGGTSGQTWEWDGLAWTLESESGPSQRQFAKMVYDDANGVCVLFGGVSGGLQSGETWEWNGQVWTLASSTGPSPRDRHAMAYDSARDRVVLFGGFDGTFYLDDTWEWDGVAWQKSPQFGPERRRLAAMTFDPIRRVSLLFGGGDADERFGDTWTWDGVQWVRVAETGPLERWSHVLTWDTVRRVGVLHGGGSSGFVLDDTWEWDGVAWSERPEVGPARWDHAAAYDAADGSTLFFGGYDGTARSRETWSWAGTAGALVLSQPEDGYAESGDTVSFMVSARGAEPLLYQWQRNGQPLSDGATGFGSEILGSLSDQLDVINVGEGDEGFYDCVVANGCGEDRSALARLQVADACGGPSSVTFAGSDTVEGDTFGQSIALFGDRLLAGAHRDVTGGINSGSAYIFDRQGTGDWVQAAKLLGSDRDFDDEFGWSTSLMDGVAVVGANRPGQPGAAYVYREQGGAWNEENILLSPEPQINDRFGQAVDALLTSLGEMIVVGANRYDGDEIDSGAAFVFLNTGGSWDLMQKLEPEIAGYQNQFGRSVSLLETDSGLFLAVGCRSDDIAGPDTGAVYLYTLVGGSWMPEAVLTAPDPRNGSWFGGHVSLAGLASGEVCVVGAERHDGRGVNTGAAYVFRRTDGAWGFEDKLLADDTTAGDRFGGSISVASSSLGDIIVVGAYDDVDGGLRSGSAYFFENREGVWLQTDKVLPAEPNDEQDFGFSVDAQLFELGPVLAVGAPLDDEIGPFSGSVSVYEFPIGAPSFVEQPTDQQVYYGDPVVFTAVANGSGPLGYQWTLEGVALSDDDRISGSQTDSLTIDPVILDDEGAYQLSLTGPCGEASSVVAYLTVICRADMNGDGVVNTQDVITFLGFWALKDPAADWNGDGTVNTLDFLAFLNEWVEGC